MDLYELYGHDTFEQQQTQLEITGPETTDELASIVEADGDDSQLGEERAGQLGIQPDAIGFVDELGDDEPLVVDERY